MYARLEADGITSFGIGLGFLDSLTGTCPALVTGR
jgi:hypothetical protein